MSVLSSRRGAAFASAQGEGHGRSRLMSAISDCRSVAQDLPEEPVQLLDDGNVDGARGWKRNSRPRQRQAMGAVTRVGLIRRHRRNRVEERPQLDILVSRGG